MVAPEPAGHHIEQLFVGGRSDNQLNFEGRIDEVAVFDRALSVQEILAIYDAAE